MRWFKINENNEVTGASIRFYKNWMELENYPENVLNKIGVEKLTYNVETNSIISEGLIEIENSQTIIEDDCRFII